jgi:hypothetical protein
MSTQETVSEDSILMTDTDESSDIETALLNSRLVEQSDPFQITDVTVTEFLEPLSTYYVKDEEARSTKIDDSSDIQMADFTTEHIENLPQISTEEVSKLLLPITPTDLDIPTEEGLVTSYFASFTKKYRVQITLLSEDGRQETVHKEYTSQKEATTLKDNLEERNYAELNPQGSNLAELESISHQSFLEGLKLKFKDLVIVMSIIFFLLFVGHAGLGYLITRNISYKISFGAASGFSFLFLLTILASISDQAGTKKTTEAVTLNLNNNTLGSDQQNRDFVAPVTVQQSFSEESQSLELSLAKNPNLSWSYNIDDSYLFEDSSVTDFYLNLGLEHAEQNETSFRAYLSIQELDTDIPYLSVSTAGSELFLYSENPQ